MFDHLPPWVGCSSRLHVANNITAACAMPQLITGHTKPSNINHWPRLLRVQPQTIMTHYAGILWKLTSWRRVFKARVKHWALALRAHYSEGCVGGAGTHLPTLPAASCRDPSIFPRFSSCTYLHHLNDNHETGLHFGLHVCIVERMIKDNVHANENAFIHVFFCIFAFCSCVDL